MPGKTLQLFLKGIEGKTTIIRINEDATIADLRKKVTEITHIKDDDLRVLYCSKELRAEDDYGVKQTLEDYNIGDQANLFVVLRLLGGSEEQEEQPKMYDSEVQLTDKPDMFTLDDDKGGQRAEMPCGHAVGPESLTAWCRSLLSAGKYEFRCPHKESANAPFCDHIWEFFTVKRLAVLTSEELKEFETKVTENYLRKAVGIQECPKCESFCERRNKNDQRVICPICTRKKGKLYEFCWFCLRTWLTSDTKDCGNFGCTGKDPRLRIIENFPRRSWWRSPIVQQYVPVRHVACLLSTKSSANKCNVHVVRSFALFVLKRPTLLEDISVEPGILSVQWHQSKPPFLEINRSNKTIANYVSFFVLLFFYHYYHFVWVNAYGFSSHIFNFPLRKPILEKSI